MAEQLVPNIVSKLAGWSPFRAGWSEGRMAVDWCHFGARRFVEPFFYESVALAMTEPFNMAFQQRTPIEALASLPPGLPIGGFIFHMSRCGSTLCTQALAALAENIVISEAAPINAVLRAPEFGPAGIDDSAGWLAGMINTFAQPRAPGERRLFVKFGAANALDLPLIMRAFPEVPWIFLYRDPVEILASHQAEGSADFLPGAIPPQRLGLLGMEPWTLGSLRYSACCLLGIGQAALAAARNNPRCLLLHYRDLPDALWDTLPSHFGFTLSEDARAALVGRTRFHAKRPDAPFADDTAAKQRAAAHLREMAEEVAGPTFAALDSARQNQRHCSRIAS
jgi:hypothetical protein